MAEVFETPETSSVTKVAEDPVELEVPLSAQ